MEQRIHQSWVASAATVVITDIIVRTDAILKSGKSVRLYQFEQCVFIGWKRKREKKEELAPKGFLQSALSFQMYSKGLREFLSLGVKECDWLALSHLTSKVFVHAPFMFLFPVARFSSFGFQVKKTKH